MAMVMDSLHTAYADANAELRKLKSMASFVKYYESLDHEEMANYWSKYLAGAKRVHFPPERTPGTRLRHALRHSSKIFHFPELTDNTITIASVMNTAWAATLSHFGKESDITFMTTSSGRLAPLEGLDRIPGCLTARVPVRVKFDPNQKVLDLLHTTQMNSAECVDYEQYGAQNIAKLGKDIEHAITDLPGIFSLQPWQQRQSVEELSSEVALVTPAYDKYSAAESSDGFFSQVLITQCFMGEDETDLQTYWNSDVLTETQADAVNDYLAKVACNLAQHMDKTVGEVLSM